MVFCLIKYYVYHFHILYSPLLKTAARQKVLDTFPNCADISINLPVLDLFERNNCKSFTYSRDIMKGLQFITVLNAETLNSSAYSPHSLLFEKRNRLTIILKFVCSIIRCNT